MIINKEELRTITEKLFLHLDELNIDSIEVSQDYYWYISEAEIYNPYVQPENLTLGQLTDDWQELKKLLAEKDIIGYNFVWLATILRAVGEKIAA